MSVIFLAHWMADSQMTGHMTSFFCKQLDAPSIGTAVDGLYILSLVLNLNLLVLDLKCSQVFSSYATSHLSLL